MAAMVTTGTLPLQVALAHVFFNLTGLIIFYPIPFMRRIPIEMARWLGRMTLIYRGFPFLYIAIAFFIVPGLLLGLSYLFEAGSIGMTVLGSMLVVIVVAGSVWFVYDFYYRNGRERWVTYFEKREVKRAVYETLPQDMIELKKNMALLMQEHEKKEKKKLLDTTEEDDTFEDNAQPTDTFDRIEEGDLEEV
jgi:solute carrier family 34 (sodium-dependent phosphate cotransporter)